MFQIEQHARDQHNLIIEECGEEKIESGHQTEVIVAWFLSGVTLFIASRMAGKKGDNDFYFLRSAVGAFFLVVSGIHWGCNCNRDFVALFQRHGFAIASFQSVVNPDLSIKILGSFDGDLCPFRYGRMFALDHLLDDAGECNSCLFRIHKGLRLNLSADSTVFRADFRVFC